jgi:hypothetical protein
MGHGKEGSIPGLLVEVIVTSVDRRITIGGNDRWEQGTVAGGGAGEGGRGRPPLRDGRISRSGLGSFRVRDSRLETRRTTGAALQHESWLCPGSGKRARGKGHRLESE